MTTHLHEALKVVTDSSTIYYNFYVDKLRFSVGISISNFQVNRMSRQKSRRHSRLENIMNQFNIIKIYRLFTQQQDITSIQVPIDYKLGDPETYAGTKI